MPTFHYQATDDQGRTTDGQIQAADEVEARQRLAGKGFQRVVIYPERLDAPLESSQPSWWARSLSENDALELADHVKDLSQAELPLASGLNAMARDLRASRLKSTLLALSERLQAGMPLEKALASQNDIPQHVRGIILAGIRTGRLGSVLGQFSLQQRISRETIRSVWTSLSYPLLVLVLMQVLVQAFLLWIAPIFAEIYRDFDLNLPPMTLFIVRVSESDLAWYPLALILLLMALFVSQVFFPGRILGSLLCSMPLVGPLWTWSGIAEFSRLLGILVQHGVPLPEALRLTGDGVRDWSLSRACRGLADQVEDGRPLADCVTESRRFPARLGALLHWGQQMGSLPETLEIAGDVYADRVRHQAVLVKTVLPPILFLVVLVTISFLVGSMASPLFQLISGLS